jgi:hypothetical protein
MVEGNAVALFMQREWSKIFGNVLSFVAAAQ